MDNASRSSLPDIEALLFDMDGTVLTSIKAAERVWSAWAMAQGLDVAAFLPTIHGVRSEETIRRLGLPGIDPVAEAHRITLAEIEDVNGIEAITGAAALLSALPADRWAIVTSAPRALALRRLEAAGLPEPEVLIAAEDVERGKPAPDCFLLAARRLDLAPEACLAFEDTAAGAQAASAAGMEVVTVTAAHRDPVMVEGLQIRDFRQLHVEPQPTGRLRVALEISLSRPPATSFPERESADGR